MYLGTLPDKESEQPKLDRLSIECEEYGTPLRLAGRQRYNFLKQLETYENRSKQAGWFGSYKHFLATHSKAEIAQKLNTSETSLDK